jgi:hypothetical protein
MVRRVEKRTRTLDIACRLGNVQMASEKEVLRGLETQLRCIHCVRSQSFYRKLKIEDILTFALHLLALHYEVSCLDVIQAYTLLCSKCFFTAYK